MGAACVRRQQEPADAFFETVVFPDQNEGCGHDELLCNHQTGPLNFDQTAHATWSYLHLTAQSLIISREVQDAFMIQAILVGRLFCCAPCGRHWVSVFRKLYPHRATLLQTPQHAAGFFYELHNIWNRFGHKQLFSWEEYQAKYNYSEAYIPVLPHVMRPGFARVSVLESSETIDIEAPPLIERLAQIQ